MQRVILCLLLVVVVRGASTVHLACHSPHDLRQPADITESVIYVKQENGLLNITCDLVEAVKNTNRAEWLTVTKVPHQLMLYLHNSTWKASFHFPPGDTDQWNLSLSIEQTFQLQNSRNKELIEDFLYRVEVDTGIYSAQGAITFYDRQPLTHWAPGDLIEGTLVLPQASVNDIIAVHSPCSGNIWLVSPVGPKSILLGVSLSSFVSDVTRWYNLTGVISLACHTATQNQALCFSKTTLKDVILTNYHIILDTSTGVYVSSRMSMDLIDSDNPSDKLSWVRAYAAGGHLIISYTPICLDIQRLCVFQDQVDITIKRPGQTSQVCSANGDLFEAAWDCRSATIPNQHGDVLEIAFNKHTGSAIVLQWSTALTQAAITIMLPTLDVAVLPTFYLPLGVYITHIKIHPHTMSIFLLGDELWASSDQGTNFYPVWLPSKDQVVKRVRFNAEGLYTEVLALSENSLRDTVVVAYGTLESHRLSEVLTVSRPATFFFSVNRAKVINRLTVKNGSLMTEQMSRQSQTKIQMNVNLAIEFTSKQYFTVFELPSAGRPAFKVQPLHIGMRMFHRNGGVAKIIGYHDNAQAAGLLLASVKSFLSTADAREETFTSYALSVSRHNHTTANISLLDQSGLTVPIWNQSDVGKALLVHLETPYIITSVANRNVVIATVASNHVESEVIVANHWRFFDLSAGSWWLEEDQCEQILHVDPATPNHMITLDLGSSAKFNIISHRKFEDSSYLIDLHTDYSNPFLFSKIFKKRKYEGYTETELSIADQNFKPSVSSLHVYYPYSSLTCPRTMVYTLLLCCPCQKRVVFNYPEKVTPKMLLEEPIDSSILYQLPVNYRPPSAQGIAIPLTSNIYNTDPYRPLYKSKFKRSQESAHFKLTKTCQNSTCRCSSTRRLSRTIANSDCIDRVYTLRLPGKLYLCFVFELKNATSNQLYYASLGDSYRITLSELNNRTDFHVEYQNHETGGKKLLPETLAEEGINYNTKPYNLRLKMIGSGLYHFRSRIPKHMSYCDLQTEFVVYVDKAPVPYPFLFLVDFGVDLGLGFAMFLVYAVYRLNTAYARYVETVHRPTFCRHALPSANPSIQEFKSPTQSLFSSVPNVTRNRLLDS